MRNLTIILLLLFMFTTVDGGPAAYIACVTACAAGCSAGTALTGTPLWLAACEMMCAPLLAAPTP
jgi:hypothetical protein